MNNDYVNNDELLEEIRKSQADNNQATERLGMMLIAMHDRILNHSNFCGYNQELKDEMKSSSLHACLRGLKHYDLSRTKAFGYFSHAIFLNYMACIMKYYRRRDKEKKYREAVMGNMTNGNKIIKQKLNWKD